MADSTPVVLYDAADGVATITLNRPERRNAINDDLLAGLTDAFSRARDDETVRAVVLTGAGKGFCAGADLSVFGSLVSAEAVYDYIISRYQPLMLLITSLPKPVIGAVNGAAAGAGASLALACDLRVMADDAVLMQAFSNIGLVPDAGGTWFFARLIGYSRAYELAIEGAPITAARCLEWGLTNRVVPAAELQEAAHGWALQLAARPTLALGLTKQALAQALVSDLASAIEYEARLQQQTIVSADHHEGVSAFLEKRKPVFRGK